MKQPFHEKVGQWINDQDLVMIIIFIEKILMKNDDAKTNSL